MNDAARWNPLLCDSLGQLQRDVQTWLDRGWILRGDIHVWVDPASGSMRFLQVVVK